jgi:hypothetical protein
MYFNRQIVHCNSKRLIMEAHNAHTTYRTSAHYNERYEYNVKMTKLKLRTVTVVGRRKQVSFQEVFELGIICFMTSVKRD